MKNRYVFEGWISVCLLYAFLSITFACTSVYADDDGEIEIDAAKFSIDDHQLKVKGALDDFDDDEDVLVELFDADRGVLLATKTVEEKFKFKVTDFLGGTPPCRIMVSAGGQSATANVKKAPWNCGQPRLVLSGVIRDSVIPFATVTITVGGVTYTTVADENGEFAVEISTIDVDALVLIESNGANPNNESQMVDMSSIAGSFSKLVEDSDGDGIVDGSENPNINNTPFTTALFVLVAAANGGELPTTEEELDNFSSQVDGTELLQTAAVIKAIVDGGVPVPTDPATGEPYDSIIEFISDSSVDENGQSPIDNFVADNSEAVNDAAEEIVNDPNIVPAFVAEDIPERYYAIPAAIDGFLARNGSLLQFESAGQTGAYAGVAGGGSGDPISKNFDWSIEGGQLKLDLTSDPFVNYSNPWDADFALVCTDEDANLAAPPECKCDQLQADIAALGRQVEVIYEVRSIFYTRLAVAGATEYVRQYEHSVATWQVGANCQEFSVGTIEQELRNEELIDSIPFNQVALETTSMAIPAYYDIGVHGYIEYDTLGGFWYWQPVDVPRAIKIDLVSFETSNNHCTAPWQDAGTLLASQPSGDSNFDLCWRVLGPGETRSIGGDIVSKEGDMELDYQDGWIQVVRRLDQLGAENGLFHDFWNTNTLERFGYYDVAVAVDQGLVFTEAMMINNENEFWNGMINGWAPGNYETDSNGSLVHGFPWGWQFRTGGILYNGSPGDPYAGQADGWEILGSDLTLDNSYTLPAGAMRLNRDCWKSRFWIPLATSIVTDPLYSIAMPNRTRLYVLEFEFGRTCGTETDFSPSWGVGPRINYEEVATGTPEP